MLRSCFCKGSHCRLAFKASHLWYPDWHTSSSCSAKCISWTSVAANARRSCLSRRKRYTQRSTALFYALNHPIEYAVLVDDPSAHLPPTLDQLNEWSLNEKDYISQQLSLSDAKTAAKEHSVANKSMSEAAVRKRQEREAKRAANLAKASATWDLLVPEPVQVPASSSTSSSVAQYNIMIPAPSSCLSWYKTDKTRYFSISAAKGAGIWDFPSNLHERARCGVFKGLREKGYFMGGGIRFGGDYLVYPGQFRGTIMLTTIADLIFTRRRSSEISLPFCRHRA